MQKGKCLTKINTISDILGFLSLQKSYTGIVCKCACAHRNPSQIKKDLQLLLVITDYLSKYSTVTAEICKSLKRLHYWKQILNMICNILYNKAKALIRKDTCMKFYNERELLYVETDASGVFLGAWLLQVREGMKYPCDEAACNTIHPIPLYQQQPILCGNQMQQHQEGSTQHITKIRNIPSLMVCLWSQHNYKS